MTRKQSRTLRQDPTPNHHSPDFPTSRESQSQSQSRVSPTMMIRVLLLSVYHTSPIPTRHPPVSTPQFPVPHPRHLIYCPTLRSPLVSRLSLLHSFHPCKTARVSCILSCIISYRTSPLKALIAFAATVIISYTIIKLR